MTNYAWVTKKKKKKRIYFVVRIYVMFKCTICEIKKKKKSKKAVKKKRFVFTVFLDLDVCREE